MKALDIKHIENWVFDLDNTLYRADSQFFSQIDRKMTAYIERFLNITTQEATKIRQDYWVKYGTTLSGLIAVNNMDPEAFLTYVHDVDLSALTPQPALRNIINKLPGRKFIFTNGSKAHAHNVAGHLNLWDLFDGSFGIEDANYIPKPKSEPYHIFCKQFDIKPETAIMFEDSPSNLEVPKSLGMKTVLITSDENWSHIPEDKRPANRGREAGWIDASTHDLTDWLRRHAPVMMTENEKR